MPYRRSNRYYRRRRSTASNLWIRNLYTAGQTDADTMQTVDLLAPLHTQDAVLKIGGQYDAAPSAVGSLVARVHIKLVAHWEKAADPAVWNFSDGMWYGLKVATWPYDTPNHDVDRPTAPDFSEFDPRDGANTEDWMAWGFKSIFEESAAGTYDDISGGLGASHAIGTWEIDVRSKRRLRELGDTTVFCFVAGGSGTQNIKETHVLSSVLLQRRN